MTVFLQNARSVLRVSHGTVPGPAGGGPNGAPARRLWPTNSMLPVWGRCGSRGGSCAPLGAAATRVTATAAETDRANRLPVRIEGPPPPIRTLRATLGAPPPPPTPRARMAPPLSSIGRDRMRPRRMPQRPLSASCAELEQLGAHAAPAAPAERGARGC